MKKIGFTLAEVLITLAVIGVVAAITLPALMADTTTAQIGPKLAKAVSMFEQANEALLNANSVDTLTDSGFASNATSYATELSNHLKGVASGATFLTKDGMRYSFVLNKNGPENTSVPGHLQRIGDVTVDINGASKPNADGTDVFYFSWWNDGSLRPKGATNWGGSYEEKEEVDPDTGNKTTKIEYKDGDSTWTSKCPRAEDGTVSDYSYCAGHVFENNFKVLYQ